MTPQRPLRRGQRVSASSPTEQKAGLPGGLTELDINIPKSPPSRTTSARDRVDPHWQPQSLSVRTGSPGPVRPVSQRPNVLNPAVKP